jgi:four helix bundle protein
MTENDFETWVMQVSEAFTKDALWKLKAYRLSLFLADLCWQDIQDLSKVVGMHALTDQLYRAVCSIGANIAEGFSRYYPLDRARFYEYA